MKTDKLKKILIIVIAMMVAIVFVIGIMFLWYHNSLKPVNKRAENGENLIEVKVEEGMGLSSISELLEESNVIKSATAMKVFAKLNEVGTLQAGNYQFDNTEDMQTILNHIVNGEIAYADVRITFIEGKNMRWIAKEIAENTNNTEEDVFSLLEDEAYINSLIQEYWFLTDEIKQDDIYYPLEGYLLPDTYIFKDEDVSVETIFAVMLNYMDKFLTEKKDEIPENLTVHQLLTLASMAELEGKSYEDRQEIVGVFFNRIYKKMNLGSDVTTYYAFKVDMGERDLTVKELNTENSYNTRGPNMAGKIPIGPICNASKSAMEATMNYIETDALYFVADKNGKIYFTKTNEQHNKMIKTLKSEGLWFVYE